MSMRTSSTKIVRVVCVLSLALLCLTLSQCASNQPVTAQYVAQGWYAKSVTVLPIQDEFLSKDAAMDYAERVADRVRLMIPGARVLVDDEMIGRPESEILEYAKTGVKTGHYLYGKIWTPRHGRDTYEVELLTRETTSGREVWSVACDTGVEDPNASGWEDAVSNAVDVILARLPDGQ